MEQVVHQAHFGGDFYTVGHVHIDPTAIIYGGVVIGSPPEAYVGLSNLSPVYVGPGTVIRENVIISRGLADRQQTSVGADCLLMNGSHVAHNCILESGVTLSSGARLAGQVRVMRWANLGINASVHQYVTIGPLAMIGMGAAVVKDVPPAETWAGVPARRIGDNIVGMERRLEEFNLLEESDRWDKIRTLTD